MTLKIGVECLALRDLDDAARGLWESFRTANLGLSSPYFDLRYVQAAADVVPGAEVALIRSAGELIGFLPFQRRGPLIQPIGAPLTDYHGVVAAPGREIDLAEILRQVDARRFRFSGLVDGGEHEDCALRPSMMADLSRGYESYVAGLSPAFMKDKRRRARRMAEELGPLSFTFGADEGGVLDLILDLKRSQMRRTGQHDVFTSPWTIPFLRRLATETSDDFGLRFAVLRAGSRVVAAEVGLRSGRAYHLWLPVYRPEFARFSPGALMTLEALRAGSEVGIESFDFGPGEEDYKRDFAEPGALVAEGVVAVDSVLTAIKATAASALAAVPIARRAMSQAGLRLDRRWDRIAACEPTLEGQALAVSESVVALGRRHPKASAGLGLGLGMGLGLLGMALD